jgi:hypothetical protein
MSGSTLRERLIEARLPSHMSRMSDGYLSSFTRSPEEAADLAITVVAEWLRGEAAVLRRAEQNATGSIRNHLMASADRLEKLADAITQTEETGQ